MIKYLGIPTITFAEFPDEVSLCLNISNCHNNCPHCSEPELREDAGIEVTPDEIDRLVKTNPGITLIGFMGGDSDHETIQKLSMYIHAVHSNIKVGMYSGLEALDMNLLTHLDYYKIGRWIMPEGPVEDWWKKNCGPIKFTFSNQVMFKKEGNIWLNITDKFRDRPINNLKKEIL